MPVYLLHEMPYDELLRWLAYFEERPVGWRNDNRAFKIMQTFGAKGKAADHFPSLLALEAKPNKALKTLPKSLFFQKISTAKGGVQIPL
jgi:hypothetical protein